MWVRARYHSTVLGRFSSLGWRRTTGAKRLIRVVSSGSEMPSASWSWIPGVTLIRKLAVRSVDPP
jgi:hypothetical protein